MLFDFKSANNYANCMQMKKELQQINAVTP